jgi:hypothetical protein
MIALPAAVGRVERAQPRTRAPPQGQPGGVGSACERRELPKIVLGDACVFNFAGYQAGCATMAHLIGHEIDFVADEKSVIS